MTVSVPVVTRPYERRYRKAVLSLLFYAREIHTHFDWYRAGQWLDSDEHHVQIALDTNDNLCGVLGVSAQLNGAGWVRLAAVDRISDSESLLQALWQALVPRLQAGNVQHTAILVMNNWILPYLPALGFDFREEVVTLMLPRINLPDPPQHTLTILDGYREDLPAITAVDHAAFAPPWQLTLADLRQAQRQAASCTLARLGDDVIGYQLSTRHHSNGHLARLAVNPAMQGQRVGAALLHHMLDRMMRRGIRSMTVNTQLHNTRSQRLYQRYGFKRNGYDLPVWETML